MSCERLVPTLANPLLYGEELGVRERRAFDRHGIADDARKGRSSQQFAQKVALFGLARLYQPQTLGRTHCACTRQVASQRRRGRRQIETSRGQI